MRERLTLEKVKERPSDVANCRCCGAHFQAWRVTFYGVDPVHVACPMRGCLGGNKDLVFREVKNASLLRPKHFSGFESEAQRVALHLP